MVLKQEKRWLQSFFILIGIVVCLMLVPLTGQAKTVSKKKIVSKKAVTINVTTENEGRVYLKKTSNLKVTTNVKSKISYKISSSKIATVSSKGVLKGLKIGKATVTITAKPNATKSYKTTTKKVSIQVVSLPKTYRVIYHYSEENKKQQVSKKVNVGESYTFLSANQVNFKPGTKVFLGWNVYLTRTNQWKVIKNNAKDMTWGKYQKDKLYTFLPEFVFDETIKAGEELHLYGVWSEKTEFSVDDMFFRMEDSVRASGLTDSRKSIQKALNIAKNNENKKITVRIPAGTYYLSDSLHVYSNTTIIMDSNTRMRRLRDTGYIFLTADSTKGGGYQQAHDITIQGGTLIGNPSGNYNMACLVRFNHCKNIILKNCNIENYSGKHAIIFAGVYNGLLDNVTIEDYVVNPEGELANAALRTLQDAEAIHIDDATKKGEAIALPCDNTPCNKITVQNCVFDNVLSGIGSHVPGKKSNGVIYVLNNEFHNVKYFCIDMYNRTNAVVKGNKVYLVENFLRNYNSTIKENEAEVAYQIEKTDKYSMRKQYKEVLDHIQNYTFPNVKSEIKTYEYFLNDLNGDGIRELVVGAVFDDENSRKLYHDCLVFTCRKSIRGYSMKRVYGNVVGKEIYIPYDKVGLYNRVTDESEKFSTIRRMTISANTLYEKEEGKVLNQSEEENLFIQQNQRVIWLNRANKVAISRIQE